jgi:hypothetical protein
MLTSKEAKDMQFKQLNKGNHSLLVHQSVQIAPCYTAADENFNQKITHWPLFTAHLSFYLIEALVD